MFEKFEQRDTSQNNEIIDFKLEDLMELVNLDERWTYKGSTTTPPCEQFVYWNVLSTVYPIKKKHLELIKIWI